MADRRRRRRNSSNTESEHSEGEENAPAKPQGSVSKERECESEFTTGGEETSECDSNTELDDDDSDDDDDDLTTEDFDDDEDDVIIEGDDWIEEERQSGDGEEEPDKHVELDDDEDKKNPAYIPRKGAFYEHDTRLSEEDAAKLEAAKEEESLKPKPALWTDSGKWHHDRYTSDQQAPKSREEIVAIYGYDIRSQDKPPEGAPRGYNKRRSDPRDHKQLSDYFSPDAAGDRNHGDRNHGDRNQGYRRGRGNRGGGVRGRGSARGGQRYGNRSNNNYTEYKNQQNTAERAYDRPEQTRPPPPDPRPNPPDVVPKSPLLAEVPLDTVPTLTPTSEQTVKTRFRRGAAENGARGSNGYGGRQGAAPQQQQQHRRDDRSNRMNYERGGNNNVPNNNGRGGFNQRPDDRRPPHNDDGRAPHSERSRAPTQQTGAPRQPLGGSMAPHIPATTAANRQHNANPATTSIYPPVTHASSDARKTTPSSGRPITDRPSNDVRNDQQSRPKRYSTQRQRPAPDNTQGGYPGDNSNSSPDPGQQQGQASNPPQVISAGHSYYPQQVFGQPTNVFPRGGPRPTVSTATPAPPTTRSFPQAPLVRPTIASGPFPINVTPNLQSPPRLPTAVTSAPDSPRVAPPGPLLPPTPGLPPPSGAQLRAFVPGPQGGATVAVNYGPPQGPPQPAPQGPPSHFQMTTPLPLAQFQQAALTKPAFPAAPQLAPPPQPAPQPALQAIQTQVTVPPGLDPYQFRSGTTYYTSGAQPFPGPQPLPPGPAGQPFPAPPQPAGFQSGPGPRPATFQQSAPAPVTGAYQQPAPAQGFPQPGTQPFPQTGQQPTGITYFSPMDQQPSPSRTPVTRRPKAAIPIINPQNMQMGGEMTQEAWTEAYYMQEGDQSQPGMTGEAEPGRDLAQDSCLSATAVEFKQKCVVYETAPEQAQHGGEETEPSHEEPSEEASSIENNHSVEPTTEAVEHVELAQEEVDASEDVQEPSREDNVDINQADAIIEDHETVEESVEEVEAQYSEGDNLAETDATIEQTDQVSDTITEQSEETLQPNETETDTAQDCSETPPAENPSNRTEDEDLTTSTESTGRTGKEQIMPEIKIVYTEAKET